ncbi:RagB/SusD family nutrient uptake outer membrane protein [Chitinophaga silvisoli]|uniref:RagB/SusD family nutrient uptake outer membrane protein n=1 Tax=Chitinophaga silvisoli TaxID=2291814 RepID=A0A3E1NXU3_9BACT|nr:RagB/SusD family nutrient uptake outer membrane protein [Chitinophaga silvisoli]RFM32568.1 RagB/SusD family nutrient uptake outer membrane protein [Chitinophaga silvisoli]
MKKYIHQLLLIAGLITTFSGCKKSRLDLVDQSAYAYDTYFTNIGALNQATIASYATLLHPGLWAREYYYIFDLMGNEAKRASFLLGAEQELGDYSFGTNNADLSALWSSLYRMIFRTNLVIDRAAAWNPTATSDRAKLNQYLAEVKFLRAYAYFHLVTLWGDVPLYIDYQTTIQNNYLSRSPAADVWKQIEKDLTEAEETTELPVVYPAVELGRATKGAVIALLGKVYLYQKKWGLAQSSFEKLMNTPYTYKLDPSFDNVFSTVNQNTPENIFQIMNQQWTDWAIGSPYYMFGNGAEQVGKQTHSGRAMEYGWNDWKNVYISNSAVKAFTYPDPLTGNSYTDPRARSTFYGTAASGGDTMYCQQCAAGAKNFPFDASDPQGDYRWKKYEYYNLVEKYGDPKSPINGQVIRLADVMLMLAEAYIQQGNTGDAPLALIDSVRSRSHAVLYANLGDQTNAMKILMRERQLELCGEQCRYFDLLRWGIIKQTINAEKAVEPGSGTQPFLDKHLLFPIPDVEKNYNPNVAKDIKNGWN